MVHTRNLKKKEKKKLNYDIKREAEFHHMQYRKVFHSKVFLNIKLFKSFNIKNRGKLT